MNSETHEIVRQIPSEEIMRLRRRLEEASGLLFQGAV
ncbi:flagellar protein FlaG [endosymbiont of unidentified scaly snail isolate Monju]|nr:flagellar protein FlaG [endosymbiont of unidentified scaly snail isolate Monju]